MHISKDTEFQRNRLRVAQSADAETVLHQVGTAGEKRLGFSSLIERRQHGISVDPGSSKGGCNTNHPTNWRKLMLSFLPSMGVGFVASMLTAIVLAADWFIWDFRYRISRLRGPELGPPGDGKDVIHVPSPSRRELVVNLEPVERKMPPVHQVEAEWLDLCG